MYTVQVSTVLIKEMLIYLLPTTTCNVHVIKTMGQLCMHVHAVQTPGEGLASLHAGKGDGTGQGKDSKHYTPSAWALCNVQSLFRYCLGTVVCSTKGIDMLRLVCCLQYKSG